MWITWDWLKLTYLQTIMIINGYNMAKVLDNCGQVDIIYTDFSYLSKNWRQYNFKKISTRMWDLLYELTAILQILIFYLYCIIPSLLNYVPICYKIYNVCNTFILLFSRTFQAIFRSQTRVKNVKVKIWQLITAWRIFIEQSSSGNKVFLLGVF